MTTFREFRINMIRELELDYRRRFTNVDSITAVANEKGIAFHNGWPAKLANYHSRYGLTFGVDNPEKTNMPHNFDWHEISIVSGVDETAIDPFYDNAMLIGLYQESQGEFDKWCDLEEVARRHGCSNDGDFLVELGNHWKSYGVAEVQMLDRNGFNRVFAAISPRGMLLVQNQYYTLDGYLRVLRPLDAGEDWVPAGVMHDDMGRVLQPTTPEGLGATEEDGSAPQIFVRMAHSRGGVSQQPPLNSQKWTGLEQPSISVERLYQIKSAVDRIEAAVAEIKISNAEKQQIYHMISAVKSLCSAPDPDWKIIKDILSHPLFGNMLGLLGILLSLIPLR